MSIQSKCNKSCTPIKSFKNKLNKRIRDNIFYARSSRRMFPLHVKFCASNRIYKKRYIYDEYGKIYVHGSYKLTIRVGSKMKPISQYFYIPSVSLVHVLKSRYNAIGNHIFLEQFYTDPISKYKRKG